MNLCFSSFQYPLSPFLSLCLSLSIFCLFFCLLYHSAFSLSFKPLFSLFIFFFFSIFLFSTFLYDCFPFLIFIQAFMVRFVIVKRRFIIMRQYRISEDRAEIFVMISCLPPHTNTAGNTQNIFLAEMAPTRIRCLMS